MINTFL
jgi:hypothetical protein